MKAKELKDKKDDELKKLLLGEQKVLRLFRFGVAGSKAKNVKEGQRLRKDIARILTEVSSRKIVR